MCVDGHCLPQSLSALVVETEPFPGPEAYRFTSAAARQAQGFSCFYLPSTEIAKHIPLLPSFFLWVLGIQTQVFMLCGNTLTYVGTFGSGQYLQKRMDAPLSAAGCVHTAILSTSRY